MIGGLALAIDAYLAVRQDQEPATGHALDPDAARRLWIVTEELLGERFDP